MATIDCDSCHLLFFPVDRKGGSSVYSKRIERKKDGLEEQFGNDAFSEKRTVMANENPLVIENRGSNRRTTLPAWGSFAVGAYADVRVSVRRFQSEA
jgi:hypothetical protein